MTKDTPGDSTTISPDEAGTPEDEAGASEEGGRPWWPFVLAGIVVLAGVSLLIPAARHQWALSIIRQPDHYTALSFRDPGGLPHSIEAGARVHLTFTVANHEGRHMEYTYQLSSANRVDAHQKVLRRATLAVPKGGQRTESVTVRPACASSTCRVQVSLPGHHETIDVLLDVHHHAAVKKPAVLDFP
jgi:Protein of unknown function (DUF1616)